MSTTTRARLTKRLGLATAVAASMMAVVAGSASAAALPSGPDAVTFNSSPGGWTSDVSYGGLCLIPGVTCAKGDADWLATGGFRPPPPHRPRPAPVRPQARPASQHTGAPGAH